ncbi:MAG: Dinitrogenase iron-molybdenum cofactor [Firmicutes bacterium ADurb.Bin146]|jgi:predicted Fe-Mo cluster-binding NifX family protein|nr:MAG: Dinitrogenase iron-molybdenum cofactor [Firmicutes bacterium ADurb.Bin146]
MKIAIPAEEKNLDSQVCVSFGRAPYYLYYNIENNKAEFMENTAANTPGGAGIQAAQSVIDNKADVLLTPRCGENAAKIIHSSGIRIYKTVQGTIKENIELYKKDSLEPLTEIHPGLHGHR